MLRSICGVIRKIKYYCSKTIKYTNKMKENEFASMNKGDNKSYS